MPRQARLDFEGCFNHLINRGIERRNIFIDQEDYKAFIDFLEPLIEEGKHRCYGWVLMPNHFHLLIETGQESISRMMSRLSTRYAVYFNRRYRRSGILFQNRFKSIVCDKKNYFKELVSYIHLNPLRAGLVKSLDLLVDYPWSGHRALLGIDKVPWQNVDRTLSHFGQKRADARTAYMEFLGNHLDVRSGTLSGGGLVRSWFGQWDVTKPQADLESYDTRILGDGDFVESMLRRGGSDAAVGGPSSMTLETAMERVISKTGATREMICKSGKSTASGSFGRALLAHIGNTKLRMTMTALADHFGVSQPAVSRLCRQGKTWALNNPKDWDQLNGE
jgi:putative transposase